MSLNVIQALHRTAASRGQAVALRHKGTHDWQSISWAQYRDLVMRAARSFAALGASPGSGIVIIGRNRPQWFVAHLGAIASGAIPTGIYTTSTADQCRFIAEHCDARIAVVENVEYLDTFLAIRQRRPTLDAIVLMEGDPPDPSVFSWRRFLELAESVSATEIQAQCDELGPDQVCSLIYTSGTTGTPKGVMLSHRNILWVAQQLTRSFSIRPGESVISYLPLSHIAEQVVSLYCPLVAGACTWFAESLERLADNLREVRPHIFFAVPRVWEKIQAAMEAAGAQRHWLARRLATWARRQGLRGGYAEQRGESTGTLYGVADALVFSRVRARLGLDRARGCFTSAAPISLHTLEFFLSLGIPILEVYGMSECTGPATLSTRDRYRSGKAGWAIPGTELKIAEDGEICMRGPHVFLGYFQDPQATREALDDQGWLHSGDVGELDADGFLAITDRRKELLITSGGKNVAPQPIESRLRDIPAVSSAVVVGDRRNYLAALLTLDGTRLEAEASKIGSGARDPATAADCPLFRQLLERQVQAVNQTLASFETVKRFTVLKNEFSVEGGELTPTLKLKRRVIYDKYAAQIDALYA